ncbi:MAG TPA: 2-dehydropantoate 2-reductase [Balneolaceae bacterium]|nr:2-dehydropantoate 2-reductase [Balneolaceae bacterium]
MINEILVMGAGAVGGYFGGRIFEKTDANVFLIARGGHLEQIRENGLQIKSTDGDANLLIPASDNPEDAPDPELILFTVKSYDTDSAIRQITPAVNKNSTILTLQNGIENYEKLEKSFGDRVLQGLCQIGAGVEKSGVIRHKAFGHIVFGEQDGSPSRRTREIADLLIQAGISCEISEEIKRDVWLKFGWNIVFNGLTAALNVTTDRLFESSESEMFLVKLFEEFQEVAKAEGVDITSGDIERILEKSRDLGSFITSTLRDRRQGKPLEYDGLTGALLRKADENSLELPVFHTLHEMLRIADTHSSDD